MVDGSSWQWCWIGLHDKENADEQGVPEPFLSVGRDRRRRGCYMVTWSTDFFLISRQRRRNCRTQNCHRFLGATAEPTGTDGHRPRSHQCWSTSKSPLVSSLKSSNRIRLAEVIPFCRQSPTDIQVPPNLAMRFLLRNGRLCYAVSLRIRNRCVKSLTITEPPTKRFVES